MTMTKDLHQPMTTEEILARQDDLADYFEQEFDPTSSFGGPLLTALVDARKARERADVMVAEAVQAARAGGANWAAIGAALGVTRQAARQRYADEVDSPQP
jgi:hypothetical protein